MPFLQKMKQQKLLSLTLLLFTLILGIVIGTLINTGVQAGKQTSAIAPDATPLTVPQAVPISNEFTKLAKRLERSVVYIQSDYLPKAGKRKQSNDTEEQDNSQEKPPPNSQDPSDVFKRFFGKPDPRSFRTEGTGTGFI